MFLFVLHMFFIQSQINNRRCSTDLFSLFLLVFLVALPAETHVRDTCFQLFVSLRLELKKDSESIHSSVNIHAL